MKVVEAAPGGDKVEDFGDDEFIDPQLHTFPDFRTVIRILDRTRMILPQNNVADFIRILHVCALSVTQNAGDGV